MGDLGLHVCTTHCGGDQAHSCDVSTTPKGYILPRKCLRSNHSHDGSLGPVPATSVLSLIQGQGGARSSDDCLPPAHMGLSSGPGPLWAQCTLELLGEKPI